MKRILAILLVALGLAQSAGHVFQIKMLKSLGFASVASPLPIVFTKQKGAYETFALDIELGLKYGKKMCRIDVTPSLYAKFDKPYWYRNAIGAAVSYAPLLPQALRNGVLEYAFLDPGVLAKAMGFEAPRVLTLTLRTKTANDPHIYTIEVQKGKND